MNLCFAFLNTVPASCGQLKAAAPGLNGSLKTLAELQIVSGSGAWQATSIECGETPKAPQWHERG